MNDATKVTVIIPCFNGASFVSEAIESALEQTYRQKEIIVVNDGSTDDSEKIIKKYDKRIKYIYQENKGLPSARNCGIEHSSGEYLAFLDADDYWDDTFLEKLIRRIQETHCIISYCGWQNIGLSGPRGDPYIPPEYESENKIIHMIKSPGWPVHAAIVRTDIVKQLGGFDVRWNSCEDFALWIKIATIHPIARVPEVLAYYRHHGGTQMTQNRAQIALNHWKIQSEFLQNNKNIKDATNKETLDIITNGLLLKKGYEAYWDRNIEAARAIFRKLMLLGYGSRSDWKYMLPALAPLAIHKIMIKYFEKK